VLAYKIKCVGGQQISQGLRAESCRDAFPKALIEKVKELVQRGFQLRQEGKVAGFRIMAKGDGCIPLLEVRERMASGQAPAW
jgi:thiamine biosynthesis protein ThiC